MQTLNWPIRPADIHRQREVLVEHGKTAWSNNRCAHCPAATVWDTWEKTKPSSQPPYGADWMLNVVNFVCGPIRSVNVKSIVAHPHIKWARLLRQDFICVVDSNWCDWIRCRKRGRLASMSSPGTETLTSLFLLCKCWNSVSENMIIMWTKIGSLSLLLYATRMAS